jgi:hypothetical protein
MSKLKVIWLPGRGEDYLEWVEVEKKGAKIGFMFLRGDKKSYDEGKGTGGGHTVTRAQAKALKNALEKILE